jgi:hypothetical protein
MQPYRRQCLATGRRRRRLTRAGGRSTIEQRRSYRERWCLLVRQLWSMSTAPGLARPPTVRANVPRDLLSRVKRSRCDQVPVRLPLHGRDVVALAETFGAWRQLSAARAAL